MDSSQRQSRKKRDLILEEGTQMSKPESEEDLTHHTFEMKVKKFTLVT